MSYSNNISRWAIVVYNYMPTMQATRSQEWHIDSHTTVITIFKFLHRFWRWKPICYHDKPEIKPLTQIKQLICLFLGPCLMEEHKCMSLSTGSIVKQMRYAKKTLSWFYNRHPFKYKRELCTLRRFRFRIRVGIQHSNYITITKALWGQRKGRLLTSLVKITK